MGRFLLCIVLCAGGCDSVPVGVLGPDSGTVRGGDEVRIAGAGFRGRGAVVVMFGMETGRGVVIESDRVLRVKTPAASNPATVDVTLAFADGTTMSIPAGFTYEASHAVVIRPRT